MFQTDFRPSCMNRASVFLWHKRFKDGRCYILICRFTQKKSWPNDKRRAKTSLTKYTSHFIVTFACERELETKQNCNILTPTLMAVSVVYFSFSRAAQPEAQGPSSLLDDGFLYCILSPTGLQNSIGGPQGPFGRVWLSLPQLVSDVFDPQLSDFLSWPSYIIVQRPLNRPLNFWNGMFDRHQAKITVMQFRDHSLPVH